jgi:uncharacterized protein (TIGR04255 family)
MSKITTGLGAPVVERIICLRFKALESQDLSEKLATWQSKVSETYPDVETVSNWKLEVPIQGGTPDFTNIEPELSLQHRYWSQGENGQRVWCMQCAANSVSFNVIRESAPHRYAELKERAISVLPAWSEHFGIKGFTGAEVVYINRLNAELTPQFVKSGGILAIGKAFKLFTKIPVEGYTIIPPYDCTVTLGTQPTPNGKLTVRVVGAKAGEAPEVDIHLTAAIMPDTQEFDCTQVYDVLDIAHDRLTDAFNQLFTEEALLSFKGPTR